MKCKLSSGVGAIAVAATLLAGCSTTRHPSPIASAGPETHAAVAVSKPSPPQPGLSPAWQPERDPEIRRLLKKRYDYALHAYTAEVKKLENGKSTTFEVLRLAGQVGDAQAQLAETPEEVIAAWEHQVRNCTGLVTEMRKRLEVGAASPSDLSQAEDECAAAEIELLSAKRAFQKTP